MPPIVKPSLLSLTEEQILRAIAGGQEDNLILQELSSLINAYIAESSKLISDRKDPAALLQKVPSCPLEKIAIGMVAAAVQAEKKKSA